MALIELENLRKEFKMGGEVVRALDGVSFQVGEGEMVAIVGPSGCGKSTLMNILGLLDVPDAGHYRLAGRPVESLTDDDQARIRNQQIGFVFQSFNLLPRMSALRNVEMPLVYSASYDAAFSRAKIRGLAQEALKRVSLENRVEHQPNELSGGQRQRVAIARALVNHPKLLLADEPTGNLDSRSGADILAFFEELNTQGVTIVIVTHDAKVAEHAPRVIEMFDGKVISDRRKELG
jgi:putative ABC transport system ATP-binding protein